jgi:hypothetical protein
MRLNAQKSWNSIAWTDPFLGAHAADTMSDSSSTFQFYERKIVPRIKSYSLISLHLRSQSRRMFG